MSQGIVRDANRYLAGVGCLLAVVLLWTAGSFITANLETGDDSWNKPFLIAYLNTACFAVYLLPTVWRRYRGLPEVDKEEHDHAYQSLSQHDELLIPSSERRSHSHSRSLASTTHVPLYPVDHLPTTPLLPKLSIGETAKVAIWWSGFWFLANWVLNASLAWTSVASVAILSSTSGFFTLVLGKVCGVESLTRVRVFAVVASFLGVVLVTRSDSSIHSTEQADLPAHPILGDIACLSAAALCAVNVIYLKLQVGNEDRADMKVMLGFAGLFTGICLLPVFPLLHYLNWEIFEMPPTRTVAVTCGINMIFALAGDYLYVLAMLKTTPMLVTVGLSLGIPLALVGSVFLPGASVDAITYKTLIGASLVILGFCMLGWQGWEESRSKVEGGGEEDRAPERAAEEI